MATPQLFSRIQALAHSIWEREGRPEGRDQVHWEQAERQLREEAAMPSEATLAEGLEPDAYNRGNDGKQQDAPGRPKSASSRQQSHTDQSMQSGSTELDHQSSRKAKQAPRSSR